MNKNPLKHETVSISIRSLVSLTFTHRLLLLLIGGDEEGRVRNDVTNDCVRIRPLSFRPLKIV